MNRPLLAALIAAGLALPAAAQAHVTRPELHRDAAKVRQERHELHRAVRQHDARGARHEKRELKTAKRELHRDSHAYVRQHRR
ncbi:MAG: hypothetical protein U1E37_11670 [Sphingomonadaceae bacterium]